MYSYPSFGVNSYFYKETSMAKKEQKSAMYFVEDEETAKIRDWWKKNGTAIIVGLVVGVGAVAGYQGWNMYKMQQAESASNLYQKMLRSLEADSLSAARSDADQIIEKYSSTAYVDAALLMLGKLNFDAGRIQDADAVLGRVMNESKDSGVRHIARLRRIAIAIDSENLNLAEELLNVGQAVGFESRYDEFRGDLSVARGDIDKAREAYMRAFELSPPGSVSAQILGRKINRVSGATDL